MQKILIKNFRSIVDKEWEPAKKMNFLIGENAIGKTSFLKAIHFAFSGEIKREEIRDGETSTFVEVTLKDGTVFSREVFADPKKATKVRVNGKATTAKALEEVLERYFKVSCDDLNIVTSREINALSSAELAATVMRFIPQKLTIKDIEKHAGLMTNEQRKIMLSLFPALPAEFGLDAIDDAYASICAERKSQKLLLADKIAQSKYEGTPPTTTLSDVESRYKAVIADEVASKASIAEITAYNSAVKKKQDYENSISDAEKELSVNTSRKPIPTILAGYEDAEKKAVAKKADAISLIKTIETNIKLFKNTLENLKSSACPLCDKLVCTTDKSCVREELENALKENEKAFDIQQKIVTECESKLNTLSQKKKEYREQEASYNQKVVLMSKIKTMKDALASIVIPAPPKTSVPKNFAKEKAELETIRREIQKYNASIEAEALLDPLKQHIEDIEVVVSQLSPKGEIKANVLEYYTNILNEEINETAQKMCPDYEFNFVAEDGLTVYFKTRGIAEAREYEYLSESEKTLCSFFLLNFINSLSGLKMLILDDINHLHKNTVEGLMELVASPTIQDAYDVIIFGSVSNPDIEGVLSKYDIDKI